MAGRSFCQPVTLRLETTSVGRLEVVLMPFSAAQDTALTGDLPQQLRDLINGDLGYCGYFNIIDPEDLPPDTTIRVRRVGDTYDTLYTFSGSSAARIHGSVTLEWEGVTTSLAIFQPPLRDPIHLGNFRFKADEVREAAHTMSAWVTRMLTGEEGSFTSKIVFVVKTGDHKDLWMMDWDGANPHSLTRDQTLNLSPTWAPDGKTLYFTSFRAGNADIYRYNLETGDIGPFIASPEVDSAPSVSPDGQWIAYATSSPGNFEVFRIRPDGTERVRLTVSYGADTSPSWAPTARDLVFTSDRGGTPQIYRMGAEGTDVLRLTFEGNYNETPRWSPRGDLIAFASREIGFQIFTTGPSGGRNRRVTSTGSNFDPSWSPDGMKIVYTSVREGRSSIWACNWDGSNARQLTFGLEATQPQWGPIVQQTDDDD